MAAFKVPSMVAPDLAIIMGLLDPPEATPPMRGTGDSARGHKRKGSPSIISRSAIDPDSDIASSCTESEDEVEAEIAVSLRTNGPALTNSILSSVKTPPSDEEGLDSDSDSSNSASSSSGSFRRRKRKTEQTLPSVIDIDSNEDGKGLLTAAAYIPTAHELSLTAIPVPSLPDPSALPQEALEFVGEIITVLPDSVTVRGGALSTYRERRDLVLDEGSLLLLDDRTPLGYVWETFGPTTLPHYLIRVQRRESTRDLTTTPHTPIDAQPAQDQAVPENENNLRSLPTLSLPSTPHNYFDPTKIFVTRAVYHIPSLSKFFFPSALAGLKGSDASNLYDEEPAENEQEFSDDEAEAAHKRLRRGSFPQEPSQTRLSGTFNGEADDSMSVVGDDASSLYGASPYDFEDIRSPGREEHNAPPSPGGSDSTAPSQSLVSFEDANTQKALMLARNSRHRRHGSLAISEQSSTAGSSQSRGQVDQLRARGRRRGRGRGKDRGREPSFTAHSRGDGRRRSRGVDLERHDRGHISSRNQASSYSFEEYDPHMPRPPSPTSLAIARATGQWADGTPFPYNSGTASGGRAISPDGHVGQTTSNVQGHMPMHYPTGPYRQEYFDPTLSFSQPLDYGPMQLGSYGVAPHINPRFAQAIQLPMSVQTSSVPSPSTTVPPGSLSTAYSHPKSEEASDTVPGLQLDD